MDVFLGCQPFEINLQSDCHVTDEHVFYVVILWAIMFFPNEITDESFYNESIRADFIQEVTLAFDTLHAQFKAMVINFVPTLDILPIFASLLPFPGLLLLNLFLTINPLSPHIPQPNLLKQNIKTRLPILLNRQLNPTTFLIIQT